MDEGRQGCGSQWFRPFRLERPTSKQYVSALGTSFQRRLACCRSTSRRNALTKQFAKTLAVGGMPVEHSYGNGSLRVYGIADYATQTRCCEAPIFKALTVPSTTIWRASLTLSRFENAVEDPGLTIAARRFIASFDRPPRHLISTSIFAIPLPTAVGFFTDITASQAASHHQNDLVLTFAYCGTAHAALVAADHRVWPACARGMTVSRDSGFGATRLRFANGRHRLHHGSRSNRLKNAGDSLQNRRFHNGKKPENRSVHRLLVGRFLACPALGRSLQRPARQSPIGLAFARPLMTPNRGESENRNKELKTG